MSSISGLYMRFRHLIHEGFKFLVIGGIGTIVTFGTANALHDIGKYKAVTIATIVATVVTFLGNRYWTFRNRQGNGTTRESIAFFILNGIGLLIYYGCIGLTDVVGLGSSKLWYNFALVIGTLLGTLFRFWSYRKWVWMAPAQPSGSATPPGDLPAGPRGPEDDPGYSEPGRDGLGHDKPGRDLAAIVGTLPGGTLPGGTLPGSDRAGHRSNGHARPGHSERYIRVGNPSHVPAHRRTS